MGEPSDRNILELFSKKGMAEKAFGMILDKYQERIYWHVRRIVIHHEDANDVMQNTFLKLWKGLDSFRGDAELFTWLYRIATNEALTFLKQKAAKSGKNIDDPEMTLGNRLQADEYFDGNEVQEKLLVIVAGLPEKQRLVFQMKYYDNMKYEEMSGVLETSVGALKASYHHAVKKIKAGFEDD